MDFNYLKKIQVWKQNVINRNKLWQYDVWQDANL